MSPNEPLDPSNEPPPRNVKPWTQVDGHQIISRRQGVFCKCGERPPTDYAGTSDDWSTGHLRDAWPILVPRLEGESYGAWRGRISEEWVTAQQQLQDAESRAGLDGEVRDFDPIPTITDEVVEAGQRVQVLERQLDVVSERARALQELG